MHVVQIFRLHIAFPKPFRTVSPTLGACALCQQNGHVMDSCRPVLFRTALGPAGARFRFMLNRWLSPVHGTPFLLFLGPLPSLYLGLWYLAVLQCREIPTIARKTSYSDAQCHTSLQFLILKASASLWLRLIPPSFNVQHLGFGLTRSVLVQLRRHFATPPGLMLDNFFQTY